MQGDLGAWLDARAGSDDEFVDRTFRLVVRREPDADARARALEKLGDGTLSRAGLVRELVSSAEFDRVELLDRGLAFAAGELARPKDHKGPQPPPELMAPAASDQRALQIPRGPPPYPRHPRLAQL